MIPLNSESKKKTALNIVDKMTVWPQCKQTTQEKWISKNHLHHQPKSKTFCSLAPKMGSLDHARMSQMDNL